MRKSISVGIFSMVTTLMTLGIVVMCCSEWVLFSRYFADERYDTLDDVASVAQRTANYLAEGGNLPEGEDLEQFDSKIKIIGETAEAYLFFTDADGRVVISSSPERIGRQTVSPKLLEDVRSHSGENYHTLGTLDGVLDEKCYVSAMEVRSAQGESSGYLFLCSSGKRLEDFRREFFSNFFFSACVMLLCASVLTNILMRRITDPLQKIADAAQRFGGGDFSVRVEGVDGEGEIANLARTFNTMAENLQASDNSRGQFMGNIAHELRTPMTTIKGFVDGMLDGTIPPELQNHYLQLVSEETGRLARLIQNMLDLSKLESGEYQVNARMFNIWETLTGVALAAEQRINDGMIELEGLTMDEKIQVYADPDLIHQVAYNLLDNAIKFTPQGGIIRFSVEKLGPEVEISVWNSGQGISPEALPFVFERFYKEDRSRGLHARGAGLGLNICKVLVNLSGGQIRVESQQGEWCRFVFTLPAVPPNPDGMLRLADETGRPSVVEEPASMRPVDD
ncbi:MAG: ATP-binding protein [Faecalibacterium sp.]